MSSHTIEIQSAGESVGNRRASAGKGPIVGIDLGTTNSLVAFVKEGRAEVLEARGGGKLIPSVVSLLGDRPVVGREARRLKVRDASHTIFSVKRLLGRGFEDLRLAASGLPYELVSAEGGVRVKVGDHAYTPIEISAMILRELRESAEAALGEPVRRAVVTVPAYFNDAQRSATRTAGRLAGLEVLRILNEPTAASLAYGLDRKKQGKIAVFDLGGGTFDVSILKLENGIFEVLATNGDTSLGGDDLDRIFFDEAVREVRAAWEIDILANSALKAALIEASEAAKIELSEKLETALSLDLGEGRSYRRAWTRAEFEAKARKLLERTREPCLQALKDAGLELGDLSDVVLVGGPTRLAIVQQIAREIFGREPNTSMHPDEVVAQGAAIQADILAGNNKELLLLDVVPLSLGIETYGGLMSVLIPRNTRIPTSARETFTTFVDNQTGVDIHVLQGERDQAALNRSLARFKLKGIQPASAGSPRVEVTFLIDADGILQVAARDLKTGLEQAVEVKPTFGLRDEEVDRMLAASAVGAAEDVAYRKLVDARNEADPVLRATERRIEDARRLLSAEEFQQVESGVRELREAMSGTNHGRILEAKWSLNRVTVRLAECMLAEALKKADSGVDRNG